MPPTTTRLAAVSPSAACPPPLLPAHSRSKPPSIAAADDSLPLSLSLSTGVDSNIDATRDDSLSYTCPDVDTSGEIYFLRMTRLDTYDGEASRRYSRRFCVRRRLRARAQNSAVTRDQWWADNSPPLARTQINQSGGSCAQPAQGWGRGYIRGTPCVRYQEGLSPSLVADLAALFRCRMSLYHQSPNTIWGN